MKIQLFEHGTLFIYPNKYHRLKIPDNKMLAERPEDLKDLLEDSPYFFTLKGISKEKDRFILDYVVEEEYHPLNLAKEYSRVLRLSLLNELLKIDPLHTVKEKVSIHPKNIFFKDMKT